MGHSVRTQMCCVCVAVAVVVLASPVQHAASGRAPQSPAQVEALLTQGSFEDAEAFARRSLESERQATGAASLGAAEAADLLIRALILNGKLASPVTRSLAEQTVRDKEALLGRTDARLVPSLLNLADVLVDAAEYAAAIAVLERATTLCANVPGADDVLLAEALDHLGSALIAAGRPDEALRALERSLALKEAVSGPNEVEVARTLERIALALQRTGKYDRAGPPVRRAVAIYEAADPSNPALAEALSLFGLQLWFEGNLLDARDISIRAVEIAERTLRADHPVTALALRRLAATLLDLGDLGQADLLLERALVVAERSLGPNHHETAGYLNDLGGAKRLLGEFASARVLFERALKLFESSYGPSHDRVATAIHNMALVDASLGDYDAARREQVRAVAIWERVFGRRHPFVALALTELASVYREEGAPAEAVALLQRALAIRERVLGPNHRDVARTLADLAAALADLGQVSRAEGLAGRALDIFQSDGATDDPVLATVFALSGALEARAGDVAAARQSWMRAVAIRERVFGRTHPAFAEAQVGLAHALAHLGDPVAALRTATAAEAAAREHLRLMLRYLPERQSLRYAATRPRGLDLIFSLAGSAPDAPELALDGLVRSRALVLDEMAARRRAARVPGDQDALLRAKLANSQQRLANLIVRGPGPLGPADHRAVMDRARQDVERAERTLAARSASYRGELGRSQIGLAQVVASLPAEGALISFVRYQRVRFDESPVDGGAVSRSGSAHTVESYLAFVLRRDHPAAAIQLGPAPRIDARIHRWREDVIAEALNGPMPPGSARRSSRASGAAVRRSTWDPIVKLLGGATRVFIVPDGALSLVPFAALPTGTTTSLLEDGPTLHFLNAERDLVPDNREPSGAAAGLLALGGPAYDDAALLAAAGQRRPPAGELAENGGSPQRIRESDCGELRTIRFPTLEGTVQEVREVGSLWIGRDGPGGDARVLVGPAASERAFKHEAPRHRVLHLATHGFFLGGQPCRPSARGTRAVGGLSTASAKHGAVPRVRNPLLLSGLALAGANQRQSAGLREEDGILTAEEVAALDLDGVEWAVLSACDTGLGQITAGEGVLGLRRAFQIAGAGTVVMSLWPVDDRASRVWMRALYEGRFRRHLPTADAVRAASLTVLHERRKQGISTSPFFWAAFVASGDWK